MAAAAAAEALAQGRAQVLAEHGVELSGVFGIPGEPGLESRSPPGRTTHATARITWPDGSPASTPRSLHQTSPSSILTKMQAGISGRGTPRKAAAKPPGALPARVASAADLPIMGRRKIPNHGRYRAQIGGTACQTVGSINYIA